MPTFSQSSIRRLEGVHPDLQKLAITAIDSSPIDFGISQGVRTKEQQAELYAQGRTKPGKVVTRTLFSKHIPQEDGYSHAFDVVVFIGGKVIWDESVYIELSKHIIKTAAKMGIKIEWGGTWPKPDYPHYQLKVRS